MSGFGKTNPNLLRAFWQNEPAADRDPRAFWQNEPNGHIRARSLDYTHTMKWLIQSKVLTLMLAGTIWLAATLMAMHIFGVHHP